MRAGAGPGADGRLGPATTWSCRRGTTTWGCGATGHTGTSRKGLVVEPDRYAVADFRLEGTGAVDGTVTDSQGRPLAGVTCAGACSAATSAEERVTRARTRRAAYLLEGLPVGTVRVRAKQDTSAGGRASTTPLEAGKRGRVDFTARGHGHGAGPGDAGLGGAAHRAGRWCAPVAKAGRSGSWTSALADTDAEGRYQLELPRGRLPVERGAAGRPLHLPSTWTTRR